MKEDFPYDVVRMPIRIRGRAGQESLRRYVSPFRSPLFLRTLGRKVLIASFAGNERQCTGESVEAGRRAPEAFCLST